MSGTPARDVIRGADGKPLTQDDYDSLVQSYLDSRWELEKLNLEAARIREELRKAGWIEWRPIVAMKINMPHENIAAIIKYVDQNTLCNLARVSRAVGKEALEELYTNLEVRKISEGPSDVTADQIAPFGQAEIPVASGLYRGIQACLKRLDGGCQAGTLIIEGLSRLKIHLPLGDRVDRREEVGYQILFVGAQHTVPRRRSSCRAPTCHGSHPASIIA